MGKRNAKITSVVIPGEARLRAEGRGPRSSNNLDIEGLVRASMVKPCGPNHLGPLPLAAFGCSAGDDSFGFADVLQGGISQ